MKYCVYIFYSQRSINRQYQINFNKCNCLTDRPKLLKLDTRNIIDGSVINTVRTIQAVGKDQYEIYKKPVITDMTQSIRSTMKKECPACLQIPSPKTKKQECGTGFNAEG